MGSTRTILAWLIASSTVGLVNGLPYVTLADDAGPGREVRAIRHDLPILLAHATPHVHVVAVAVDKNAALAEWDAAGRAHIDYLFYRFNQWWLQQEVSGYPGGPAPSSRAFSQLAWLPPSLVAMASHTLPAMIAADAKPPAPAPAPVLSPPAHAGALVKSAMIPCIPYDWISAFTFGNDPQKLFHSGDYDVTVTFATNDAKSGAHLSAAARAPTEAESWETPGGNSYFFFSGVVHSDSVIHVNAGTTIDVWFPFVLDPQLHYALTLAHADKPIGPIDGTLKDNVVHFVLPAFALAPHTELFGEVEGDAWPHYDGP
jgi:hypothetical protein